GAAPSPLRAGTGDTSVPEFGQEPLGRAGTSGRAGRWMVEQAAAHATCEDLLQHGLDLTGRELVQQERGGRRRVEVHRSPSLEGRGRRRACQRATQARAVRASTLSGSRTAVRRSTVRAGPPWSGWSVRVAAVAVTRPCPLPAPEPRISVGTVASSRTRRAIRPRTVSSGSYTSRTASAAPPQCT